MALLWPVLNGTGRELKAGEPITAKIVSLRVVDVCGIKRDQVVVVIDLGKIVKSDSLFGCNFQLSFDSTKLRFHSALYLNTLAEFFEFKQVGFSRKGQIIGAIATMGMYPVAGQRPLIGFLGDYIGECKDSAWIVFDYLEFTDEFTRKVVFENNFVEALVADKPDRYFKLVADSDTTVIDTNAQRASFKIIAHQGIDSTLSKLDIKLLTGNFDNFYVESVESADSDLLTIDSLRITADTVDISFFVNGKLNNKEIAVISIAEKEKAEEVAEILIKPVDIDDDCSCFKQLISSTHYIKSAEKKQDTTTSVTDFKADELFEYYSAMNNEWIVENRSNGDCKIMIYDAKGNQVMQKQCYVGISRISLDRFATGVYYGIIQYSNYKKIKMKILIKN